MKTKIIICLLCLCGCLYGCSGQEDGHQFGGDYRGHETDHISFPMGGIGAGMICLDGTGSFSHVSIHNRPEMFNEPVTFAAVCVKGENGNETKVVEAIVPDYKKFGRTGCGSGGWGASWGLARFEGSVFSSRFPFADVALEDSQFPLKAAIRGWSPFIPGNADDSSLPVACVEYTFTNPSDNTVEAVFSFNSANLAKSDGNTLSAIHPIENGMVQFQEKSDEYPFVGAQFVVFTDSPETVTDCCWFRGGWFDPLTMAWNHASDGKLHSNPETNSMGENSGGSLYVPLTLAAGESKTITLNMLWYVPENGERCGAEPKCVEDFGNRNNPDDYGNYPKYYKPYYSYLFGNMEELVAYWNENRERLRKESMDFSEAFYDNTLPSEVVEAIASNLTILKSTTVRRDYDGRFWAWEGSGDNWGSCEGTTTHVWNYNQTLPHLFPALERSLRKTEFIESQDTRGHQCFRSALPVRPLAHTFHAAADGQLGGIIKVYRDWRIFGDTEWIRDLYPQIKQSMDYCIATWDPRETGALEEPHHNTYDIEFWGPDGMCTSFYGGALNAMVHIGSALGEDVSRYESLLAKCQNYMSQQLWNGEYFQQNVRWKDLDADDPSTMASYYTSYSPEAIKIMEQEGPKYQYASGCLSDGVIGAWMSLAAGLDEPFDKEQIKGHLLSVYKYNLKKNLSSHSIPQRPTFAMGNDGGLLICTWPRGGKPQLPFVYSDEVWTGIEYQVAAHLMFEGEVEKGLDIVRTLRKRYDGTVRNPFNEYECGNWYARALSSYSMIQALTGVRYDAVDKVLYIDSKIGNNFRSFLSTEKGYGTVGLKNGEPFIEVRNGEIPINRFEVK